MTLTSFTLYHSAATVFAMGPTHTTLHMLQNERVLFHYNGHGVPRPTANGEVWVFNKSYTQYIPMSIYDLQTWVGAPCICVFDCSAAGLIVNSFRSFADQRQQVPSLMHNSQSLCTKSATMCSQLSHVCV